MSEAAKYTHTLIHDDNSRYPVGRRDGELALVERGLGKYWEVHSKPLALPFLMTMSFADEAWRDYRVRMVVTPVSFDDCGPTGGFCGVVARHLHEDDYIALVLDRHFEMKLLRRTSAGFDVLARAPLEFCLGQSLTLTLTVDGGEIIGTAGPYAGATTIKAPAGEVVGGHGRAGFVCSGHARFGPHTVECSPEEFARVGDPGKKELFARLREPGMKVERTVPLHGLLSGENFVLSDINGDGKPELIVAQSSKKIAASLSLTRLTCLTALDLDGKVIWQAGVPDPDSASSEEIVPAFDGALPFRVHDLFGDGHPVVVCVFGYDLQIRDAKTGRVMMSASTPDTRGVTDEFKAVTSNFGAPWGDETLNMNVASIAFCDTQGNGGRREILIKDDYHNLAVLDTMSDPILHALFRHRGNTGGEPWVGDIDGDGKDEIFCGYSLLDDDGRVMCALPIGGRARSVCVEKATAEMPARAFVCAGEDGLFVLDLETLKRGGYARELPVSARVGGIYPEALQFARFRTDVPGLQILAVQRLGEKGFEKGRGWARWTLFDQELHRLWSFDLDNHAGRGEPVQWRKDGTTDFLVTGLGGGLLDGLNETAVTTPKLYDVAKVARGYCADGRDAVLGIYENELQICVPEDSQGTSGTKGTSGT